jgi:hypothetical protein
MTTMLDYRRDDLDRALHGLRVLMIVAAPHDEALGLDRPYPITPAFALDTVAAARRILEAVKVAGQTTTDRCGIYAVCLAASMQYHANNVVKFADALARELVKQAEADDASSAEDGASLVGDE